MVGYPMLKHTHPMVGLDFHDEVTPPGVPAPKIPHLVAGVLCFPPWGIATGKPNGTVMTTTGIPLSQGTDMGFFIPHIPLPPAPANLLAPIITLVSGSKSHFGAHNRILAQGPAAFACLYYVNLNLNCGGAAAPPLPSGFVLALFQLTLVDVTFGDMIAGVLHLVVDLFIQFGLNRGLNAAGNWLGNRIAGALANRVCNMGVRLSSIGVKTLGEFFQAVLPYGRASQLLAYSIEQVPSIILGDLLGTPVGYSAPFAPVSQGEGLMDQGHSALAQSIDNMLNSPSVEQHPSAAPQNSTPSPAPGTP